MLVRSRVSCISSSDDYVYVRACARARMLVNHQRLAPVVYPPLCGPVSASGRAIQEYHLTRFLVIQPTLETRCNQRITPAGTGVVVSLSQPLFNTTTLDVVISIAHFSWASSHLGPLGPPVEPINPLTQRFSAQLLLDFLRKCRISTVSRTLSLPRYQSPMTGVVGSFVDDFIDVEGRNRREDRRIYTVGEKFGITICRMECAILKEIVALELEFLWEIRYVFHRSHEV